MTDEQSKTRAVDSLSANEFGVEIEGQPLTGVLVSRTVQSVSGRGMAPAAFTAGAEQEVQREAESARKPLGARNVANPRDRVDAPLEIVTRWMMA